MVASFCWEKRNHLSHRLLDFSFPCCPFINHLCCSDNGCGKTFQHLEQVIKSRIPGLQSLISKTINELETELSRLGRPVATDAGVSIPFYLWFD